MTKQSKRRTPEEAAEFMLTTVEEHISSRRGTVAAMETMLLSCEDRDARHFLSVKIKRYQRNLEVLQARRGRMLQLVERAAEYSQIEDEIRRLVQRRAELLNPLEQATYVLALRGDSFLSWD